MDAITQQLMQQLAGGGLSKIGKQIGADEKTAGAALSTAVPLLVSALAKNTSKPDGAQSLFNALSKDHDGSIFDDIGGFLGNPAVANGAGILGHIFGGQQSTVTQGLSKGTGLNIGQIAQLLQIVAPLVMGLLGKQQQQQGFDTNSLSAFLGGQRQQVQQSNPNLMSTLNNLLDANQDGSALDDIVGLAGKLFGKKK